jgi:hypothetical protein
MQIRPILDVSDEFSFVLVLFLPLIFFFRITAYMLLGLYRQSETSHQARFYQYGFSNEILPSFALRYSSRSITEALS